MVPASTNVALPLELEARTVNRTSHPRRAEAAATPPGGGKICRFLEHRAHHRRHHQLGNPVTAAESRGRLSQVDKQDLDLAPIVGVDGARRIDKRKPPSQRQTRTWSHLPLESLRNSKGQTSRYRTPLPRGEHKVFLQSGVQIRPGSSRCCK